MERTNIGEKTKIRLDLPLNIEYNDPIKTKEAIQTCEEGSLGGTFVLMYQQMI